MMKYLFCVLFLLTLSSSWATPATQIQLSYDIKTKILHVQASHPTDRMDRYYIRRVVVKSSTGQEQTFDYKRQDKPALFVADLNFTAEAGDHLVVEIYSSEGGIGRSTIEVSKELMKEDINEKKIISYRK